MFERRGCRRSLSLNFKIGMYALGQMIVAKALVLAKIDILQETILGKRKLYGKNP